MRNCGHCGEAFEAASARRAYCSDKCRQAAYRGRVKKRTDKDATKRKQFENWRDQLRRIDPVTADEYSKHVEAQGLDCAHASLQLTLRALNRGRVVFAGPEAV